MAAAWPLLTTRTVRIDAQHGAVEDRQDVGHRQAGADMRGPRAMRHAQGVSAQTAGQGDGVRLIHVVCVHVAIAMKSAICARVTADWYGAWHRDQDVAAVTRAQIADFMAMAT
jgi:hypothetical protein